jgi:hypothetical protein
MQNGQVQNGQVQNGQVSAYLLILCLAHGWGGRSGKVKDAEVKGEIACACSNCLVSQMQCMSHSGLHGGAALVADLITSGCWPDFMWAD